MCIKYICPNYTYARYILSRIFGFGLFAMSSLKKQQQLGQPPKSQNDDCPKKTEVTRGAPARWRRGGGGCLAATTNSPELPCDCSRKVVSSPMMPSESSGSAMLTWAKMDTDESYMHTPSPWNLYMFIILLLLDKKYYETVLELPNILQCKYFSLSHMPTYLKILFFFYSAPKLRNSAAPTPWPEAGWILGWMDFWGDHGLRGGFFITLGLYSRGGGRTG